jgi:3-hydroxyisobutyrate dehydrogenase-like beta-hydroxyacid dehydrogenase
MPTETVGILHPGDMGAFIGAMARQNGHTVYWASEGRSPATRVRAERAGLRDARTLPALCAASSVIVSVCPPHAAEVVANDVAAYGFQGMYVDANAIAPQRSAGLAEVLEEAGIDYVDGALIGGPAWEAGQTTDLFLSGARALTAAQLLGNGKLSARVLGPAPGQASALKMCYAAYTKGTTALLGAILAAADALDVRAPLVEQWSQDDPDFAAKTKQRVRRGAAKAWRFAGEMDEIAATFRAVGLPDGFHTAAAELFQRQAGFKDRPAPPELDELLDALRTEE